MVDKPNKCKSLINSNSSIKIFIGNSYKRSIFLSVIFVALPESLKIAAQYAKNLPLEIPNREPKKEGITSNIFDIILDSPP